MTIDTYKTLVAPSTSFIREKGSKFYGLAYPAGDEDEVKEILAECRKKYFDATHHCYAYILGKQGQTTRANDDGEPNHSAGDPILGQIKSFGLTNVLVIVVRHYGGTKLGVGGLISAYKSAAQLALEAATITEKKITEAVLITFPYEHTSEVMRQVSELGITIENQQFDMECRISGQIPISQKEQLVKNLELSYKVKVAFPMPC